MLTRHSYRVKPPSQSVLRHRKNRLQQWTTARLEPAANSNKRPDKHIFGVFGSLSKRIECYYLTTFNLVINDLSTLNIVYVSALYREN